MPVCRRAWLDANMRRSLVCVRRKVQEGAGAKFQSWRMKAGTAPKLKIARSQASEAIDHTADLSEAAHIMGQQAHGGTRFPAGLLQTYSATSCPIGERRVLVATKLKDTSKRKPGNNRNSTRTWYCQLGPFITPLRVRGLLHYLPGLRLLKNLLQGRPAGQHSEAPWRPHFKAQVKGSESHPWLMRPYFKG